MPLSDLIAEFVAKASYGVMLDSAVLNTNAIASVRFYAGYAELEVDRIAREAAEAAGTPWTPATIDTTLDITDSEWAIILPLFSLYVERESAKLFEASRGMGVDVPGRASSEIEGDIKLKEEAMPKEAFFCAAVVI